MAKPKKRYCTLCGDRIDDDELRGWHVANEHPFTRDVTLFCLFCGEYVPESKRRAYHYDVLCTNYPGRELKLVP